MSIVELETTELGFGIRKYIDSGNQLKLFVDGGFLKADVTLSVSGSGSASDDGTGFWLGGGVDYMVTDAVSVGVNARFSSADDSDGFDIGGTHFGFSVGYHLK